jgi:hypothetical protein
MSKKRIARLVIHCTATPEGREVTADDIRRWHCAPPPQGRGWKQVGYTDMVHLDGTIERLVKNNEDAYVDGWEVTNGAKGHNADSRHIVYVGGVASDRKTPKDTRTEAQRKSLAAYVDDFRKRFPWADVCGHCDLPGVAKACPSYNVRKEYAV